MEINKKVKETSLVSNTKTETCNKKMVHYRSRFTNDLNIH